MVHAWVIVSGVVVIEHAVGLRNLRYSPSTSKHIHIVDSEKYVGTVSSRRQRAPLFLLLHTRAARLVLFFDMQINTSFVTHSMHTTSFVLLISVGLLVCIATAVPRPPNPHAVSHEELI